MQKQQNWDYRSIILLNTDYMIPTRVIVNRLRPWLPDLLHADQHCGTAWSTVYDAPVTVRDVVAYTEYSRTPVCELTIDFTSAFDLIAHDYLQETLRCHGFSERMTRRILSLYDNATSKAQISGFLTSPIPIQASTWQGCPLNMYLFALCLNPLITTLNESLPGIRIHRTGRKIVDMLRRLCNYLPNHPWRHIEIGNETHAIWTCIRGTHKERQFEGPCLGRMGYYARHRRHTVPCRSHHTWPHDHGYDKTIQ
jgi:hypothetical protein